MEIDLDQMYDGYDVVEVTKKTMFKLLEVTERHFMGLGNLEGKRELAGKVLHWIEEGTKGFGYDLEKYLKERLQEEYFGNLECSECEESWDSCQYYLSEIGKSCCKDCYHELLTPLAVNKKEDGLPPTPKGVGIRPTIL